jgi:hypothetical protein
LNISIPKKEIKILGKWQVPLEMSNESQRTEVDVLLSRPLVGVELLNFELRCFTICAQ